MAASARRGRGATTAEIIMVEMLLLVVLLAEVDWQWSNLWSSFVFDFHQPCSGMAGTKRKNVYTMDGSDWLSPNAPLAAKAARKCDRWSYDNEWLMYEAHGSGRSSSGAGGGAGSPAAGAEGAGALPA